MFRQDTWSDGFYIDNHDKYQCLDCNCQFIVGNELLKRAKQKTPICPYYGRKITELISCTEDDMLDELASDLGCLGIYIDDDATTEQ